MAHKLFPSQQPNEKVYLVFREHWFRLFLKFAGVALLALLPLLIRMLFIGSEEFLETDQARLIALLFVQIYYLGLVITAFFIWVLYYLNLGIVSELRLVDIDQRGLLKHEVSELNLDAIEDVSSETIGLFGNILDYGTVYIQTAGTTERFEFDKIHNPKKVASIILTLYEQRKKTGHNKPT
jgi:hypothetical protein